MPATAAEALIAASEFTFGGKILSAAPYGSGHINDTFLTLVETSSGTKRFILQRINHQVFKQPDLLMENVERVCAHAHAKQDLIGSSHHLVLTANHPSPLSARRPPRPFVGCGHFSAVNAWLEQHGRGPVLW
jgi:uracil DNA glycosylase